jgi:hypothetical protein
MDPRAVLELAQEQFRGWSGGGSFDEFRATMRSYAAWRRRGGFEPVVSGKPGDAFWAGLVSAYGVFGGSGLRDSLERYCGPLPG